MKILALSGSLRRESYNTALARAARELAPDGVEIEIYDGLGLLPHYDAGPRPRGPRDARARRRPPAPDRGGGCAPRDHARVQRHPAQRPEERDRLGLRTTPRELAPQQDRRDRGRNHRPVRRDLGPAGLPSACSESPAPASSGASCRCRRRTSVSTRTATSWIGWWQNACASISRHSCERPSHLEQQPEPHSGRSVAATWPRS